MKISVSSYSYSALKLSDIEAMKLAKEMGFDGIEFAEIHPDEGVDKKEYALSLFNFGQEIGLPIVNYAIGADFINKDVDEEIERLKGEVDVAEKLGVKTMRHDASSGPENERFSLTGFEKYLPVLAKGCKGVTEYAKTKGIKTSVENHGYFCQQSDRVEALMNAVDDENFGWLVDIGNFMCADEKSVDAVKVGAKHAIYVHAKDFYFVDKNEPQPDGYFDTRGGNHLCGSVLGDGVVPVKECLDIIKDNGYDGWITLEYEGQESPATAVPKGLEFLKSIL
ncbi:MAG: sugar phosphate isomerase/epimerase [Ruminococcus sp.]|nr:sugar phosphate isomerase/epimerase [Candidatus Copronaster equi]